MKYPYDDEAMRYDKQNHMYVLKESYVLDALGINLSTTLNTFGDANPSTLAQRWLLKVSRYVYQEAYKDSQNESFIEYIMAKHPHVRSMIKDMLESQVLYNLENGFLGLYSGVNVSKGTVMPLNALRGVRKVSDDVEIILNKIIPGLGIPLKYIGALPNVPHSEYRRDY